MKDIVGLSYLDKKVRSNPIAETGYEENAKEWAVDIAVYKYVHNLADPTVKLTMGDDLIDNMKLNQAKSNSLTDLRNRSFDPSLIDSRVSRTAYFANFFRHKIEELSEKYGSEFSIPSDEKVYYTVRDLGKDSDKVIILDGTGHVLLKDTAWKIVDVPDKYKMHLNLKSLNLVHTLVKRTDDQEYVRDAFVDVIKQVLQANPGEKILVYMWKDVKYSESVNDRAILEDNDGNLSRIDLDDDTPLAQSVMDKLSEMGVGDGDMTNMDNPVQIVTYQSGNEKATSRYMDRSVAVVLGDFNIPNSAIYDLNRSNGVPEGETRITNENLYLSLVIQFIYRTKARNRFVDDNSIKLYLDSKHEKLIPKILGFTGEHSLTSDEFDINDSEYTIYSTLKDRS